MGILERTGASEEWGHCVYRCTGVRCERSGRMHGMHNCILKLILSFASSISATYMQSYPLYQGSYIQLLEHPAPYNADMS